MSRLSVFVGLDYHPGSVQVCVLDASGKVLANGTRPNDAAELDRTVRQFGAGIQAAIEVSPGAPGPRPGCSGCGGKHRCRSIPAGWSIGSW